MKELLRLKKEDYQKLAAVGILTDGAFMKKPSRNTCVIEFYSNDSLLHSAFKYLMKCGFNRQNTSYCYKDYRRSNGSLIVTGYELSRRDLIVKILETLSPTYKTKKDSDGRPSLEFLLSQNKVLKELAVRFAMSCDGCVSVAHMKSGEIIPSLKFACAHPSLVEEWKILFKDVGVNTYIDKDRANWSGIHGIKGGSRLSLLTFQKIGGFYPHLTRVQGGNYRGLAKNNVLDGICSWFNNKKENIDRLIFNKAVLL